MPGPSIYWLNLSTKSFGIPLMMHMQIEFICLKFLLIMITIIRSLFLLALFFIIAYVKKMIEGEVW